MKPIIGLIGSYSTYFIGNFCCSISYIKINGTYLFERKYLQWMGEIFANAYQKFMNYSADIQDWAKLNRPWKNNHNSLM